VHDFDRGKRYLGFESRASKSKPPSIISVTQLRFARQIAANSPQRQSLGDDYLGQPSENFHAKSKTNRLFEARRQFAVPVVVGCDYKQIEASASFSSFSSVYGASPAGESWVFMCSPPGAGSYTSLLTDGDWDQEQMPMVVEGRVKSRCQ
jgi:hypothetical protein